MQDVTTQARQLHVSKTSFKSYGFVLTLTSFIVVENAKIFKEELLKKNVKNSNTLLNLSTLRLGINSIIALSNAFEKRPYE